MRAFRPFPIALLLLLLTAVTASAQTVRYADPPIVTVQLSSVEPAPPGVPLDIYYGGLGGGAGALRLYPPAPVWEITPGALASGTAYFAACGYQDQGAAPPAATLTTPSGAILPVTVDPYTDDVVQCYDYALEFAYGIELGIYTLTLRHPDGDLSHTFGYDYPFCWRDYATDGVQWITGLAPDEQVTLYFYLFQYEPGERNFIAQRSVRADADGVVVYDLDVARSAPFRETDLFAIPTTVGRTIIETTPAMNIEPFTDLGFTVAPIPQPATPPHTFAAVSGFNADPRGIPCDGEHEQFAITHPLRDAAPIPLYARVNGSEQTGVLAMGELVEILESVPALTDGRVYAWNRVITQSGVTGWTPSLNLITVFANLSFGARARVLTHYQLVNGVHQPIPVPLFTNDGGSRPLPAGTELTLLAEVADGWEVRLDDNTTGVIAFNDPVTFAPSLEALPWPIAGAPFQATPIVDDGGAPATAVVIAPALTTPVPFACPGSPPPRLTPGITARVTPGDPNNIRVEPEAGRVIGEIPGGAQFRVLNGPTCGPTNGLTWWQVEYNGVIGWTAEGTGSVYWLEPLG